MSAGVAGCNGGGGGYYGGGGGYTDPYQQAWYDVYGYHCGSGSPRAGCNFYADGYKIMDYEDPYFYSSYVLYYDYWYYYDSWGYPMEYTGWAWESPTGIIYDEWGYALNEDADQGGRDVIADVAEKEEQVVAVVGKSFAEKYALSEDTGVMIARTLNDWATLGKKRGRTDADVAAFTERLYGISAKDAQAALEGAQSGELSALEGVNEQIAAHWSTDPETSKKILKSWYAKQLEEIGAN